MLENVYWTMWYVKLINLTKLIHLLSFIKILDYSCIFGMKM